MEPRGEDIGHDHFIRYYGFAPDRALNPQYEGIADEEKSGLIVDHRKPDGSLCSGGLTFDTPAMQRTNPDRPRWTVTSWEPLTIEPSVQFTECGDHGFIRNGRWEPA